MRTAMYNNITKERVGKRPSDKGHENGPCTSIITTQRLREEEGSS